MNYTFKCFVKRMSWTSYVFQYHANNNTNRIVKKNIKVSETFEKNLCNLVSSPKYRK